MTVMERARRRITRRLMPFLLLLYVVSFLDRTNLAVAALGMRKELGFTEAIIGSGAGIFFLGYFLLEIPGTLLVERWSARKWIARILISWGLVAGIMGLIGLPMMGALAPKSQFFWLRFLLGLAEAGFFPGVVVYLTHWFRYEDRARAKSLFMIGIPLASVISTPLSQIIMHRIEWLGLAGWRWVFILEGIPAVVLGFVTLFYLTDRPHDAKWLPDDEKQWIVAEIEQERQTKTAEGGAGVVRGLIHPRIMLLTAIYFFGTMGLYGLTFFLPSMMAAMKGNSVVTQTVVSTLPYVFGCAAILVNGWHSDRTGERRWHTSLPLLLGGVAMGLSVLSGDHLALAVTFLCFLGAGMHAHYPVFWTHPGSWLTGSASAAAVGLINSFGNLGGFFGPKIVGELTTRTGSFQSGMWFLSASLLAAGLLAAFLKPRSKLESPG
ncbi:MAG: MFS transporter [Fimbriimonas sp.]|nr:MFS transporter [Fimbriimonas sp.]